jgi:three-Cys-motif partner protein
MAVVRYDQIGYWSELKLEIVRKYAAAYSGILSKQKVIKRHVYIDAFAGAGKHISKKTGAFIAGSPLNALLVKPPFSEFHFIDLDRKRVAALTELASEQSNVSVHEGNCNEVVLRKVFPRCRYEDYACALCLLDPYSLNVDWSVLETAGRIETVEVFYNFMIMDANMNVFWRNPDQVPEKQTARMSAVWGDDSWRAAVYVTRPGLFGDVEEKASNERVANAFRERLKK